MKKILFLTFLCALLADESNAQFTRFIVRFKDKGATTFTLADTSAYLSARANTRRKKYNIPVDSTDLPVPATYINEVKSVPGVILLNVSKWLNAITIDTTDPGALAVINALPFVQSTSGIAARQYRNAPAKNKNDLEVISPVVPAGRMQKIEGDFFNYGTSSFNEIHLHKGEFLHNIGLRGQGMQVAMLDGGFFNYTGLRAFDSANLNGQILSTWDFVAGQASVTEDHPHGMMCLSTIAANIPGQFVGKAPKASFHLFRTEDVSSEQKIEEFNWACGAERADSSGADIISTSLGYYIDFTPPSVDHPYSDMNGDITMAAIAGDLAAKKGLMVFASIGNDGNEPVTKFLSTPSDGDSVVAVGAVSTAGSVASFSSYGPSADGRVKPDLASVGVSALVENTNNTVGTSNGTSFACPNMAGLGTCLWQGFPEFNNMRIVRALKEASSSFNTPDTRVGYGIPDMKAAFSSLLIEYATSSVSVNSCTATLNWSSKDVDAMKYEVERKAPGDLNFVKIADINPLAGNILANHNYQFTNILSNVAAGTVSYRVRQIIDTAAATFTAIFIDTANVTLSSACTTTGTIDPNADNDKITVLPNPTAGNATLVIQTRTAISNMAISVFDMKGRLVIQLVRSKGPGKVNIDLPSHKLSKGKYIISVYDKGKLAGTAELLKL